MTPGGRGFHSVLGVKSARRCDNDDVGLTSSKQLRQIRVAFDVGCLDRRRERLGIVIADRY